MKKRNQKSDEPDRVDGYPGAAAIENPVAIEASCGNKNLTVHLADGRTLSVPITWFPRLANATPTQRAAVEVWMGGVGLRWEEIDEDINIRLLLGLRE